MKKIMLCCNAGMSTSLLVTKMIAAAESQGIDVEIKAYGTNDFDAQVGNYHVVMLAPQVQFMKSDFDGRSDVPVVNIDMMDYGMINGDKVLAQALAEIGE